MCVCLGRHAMNRLVRAFSLLPAMLSYIVSVALCCFAIVCLEVSLRNKRTTSLGWIGPHQLGPLVASEWRCVLFDSNGGGSVARSDARVLLLCRPPSSLAYSLNYRKKKRIPSLSHVQRKPRSLSEHLLLPRDLGRRY